MIEKIVNTQKALNDLIDSGFDGLVIIKDNKEEINIFKNGKSLIAVSGSAQIGNVYGSAQIGSVSDSAQIGNVFCSAQIRNVYGSAQIGNVSESAQIGNVSDLAQIGNVYGSAQIGNVSGSAQIGNVYGSAQIGNVSGSAQIGNVFGNGLLSIYSSLVTIKNASNKVILICYELPKIIKKTSSVRVIKTTHHKETNFTIQKFIDVYDVEKNKDSLVLYKSVKDDYTDFYTGKVKYEIGKTVTAPDWDDKYEAECGKGLHLSPTPYFALQFHDGKVLKCRVKRSDCRTIDKPEYPYKVRCKQVEVLEEVKSLF